MRRCNLSFRLKKTVRVFGSGQLENDLAVKHTERDTFTLGNIRPGETERRARRICEATIKQGKKMILRVNMGRDRVDQGGR